MTSVWLHRGVAGVAVGIMSAGILFCSPAAAENWPSWRGPGALGISTDPPPEVDFASGAGPRWKVELAGESTSTPIVWDDLVFVTSQRGKAPIETRGEEPAPEADSRLVFVVEAFERESGERRWSWELPSTGELQPVHMKHNLASPSPVTDGERLIVWFGTGQVAALDLRGNPLWQRHLGEEFGAFEIRWAHGSSPVLVGDSVVFLCDHTPNAYLLAVDKRTGETIWKTDRAAPKRSYATPLLIAPERPGERAVLVVNSDSRIDAYDAETGEAVWHVGQPARVPVASPVYADGVLYSSRGYRSGPYLAVRLEGTGDLGERMLWRHETGAPYVSSLLHHDGLVYMATENGVASAVDAASGETVWKQRLGGYFSASPVVAGNRIYLLNEESELFVIAVGREFRLLDRTEIGERTLATPALSEGQLFVRSDRHLMAYGRWQPPEREATE